MVTGDVSDGHSCPLIEHLNLSPAISNTLNTGASLHFPGSMARVIVRMFATVREAAGTDSVQVEAENVIELLMNLKSLFGPRFSRTISDFGSDQDSVVILINGMNPGRASVLSCSFSDGDEVAIFPPVSGG